MQDAHGLWRGTVEQRKWGGQDLGAALQTMLERTQSLTLEHLELIAQLLKTREPPQENSS